MPHLRSGCGEGMWGGGHKKCMEKIAWKKNTWEKNRTYFFSFFSFFSFSILHHQNVSRCARDLWHDRNVTIIMYFDGWYVRHLSWVLDGERRGSAAAATQGYKSELWRNCRPSKVDDIV